jgi:hypothetical protein
MRNKATTKNLFTKGVIVLPLNEARVYKTLYSLTKRPARIISISLRKLARKAQLCYESTRRAVSLLKARGVILYSPGKNQWITSCFITKKATSKVFRVRKNPTHPQSIPKRAKNISRKAKFPSKKSNVNVYKYILNNVNVGNSCRWSAGDFGPRDLKEARAFEIAETFKDEQNLGLYLVYCRKYPADIINKAFKVAKEIPSEKIKRSRGAFFTYLVKKYAQNQNYPDSGN